MRYLIIVCLLGLVACDSDNCSVENADKNHLIERLTQAVDANRQALKVINYPPFIIPEIETHLVIEQRQACINYGKCLKKKAKIVKMDNIYVCMVNNISLDLKDIERYYWACNDKTKDK